MAHDLHDAERRGPTDTSGRARTLAPSVTIGEWLRELAGQGIELWFEGDQLRFRAPTGALGPSVRAEIAARKREIVTHLRAKARSENELIPLSFNQQSLWFLHQQVGDSTAYQVAMSVRVLSTIDVGALRHALQAIVDRHASLRTSYVVVDGSPCQRVVAECTAAFDVRDAAGLGDAELRRTVEAEYARRFDLESGPVFRASLFTRGAEDHVLLITVHHIAADGWSLVLLFEELLKLYAEATGGPAAGLARPTLQFADYVAWQQKLLSGPEGERLFTYWQQKLAPPRALLDLPADRPRPAIRSYRGASWPVRLGPDVTKRLKELARQEDATPFVVLLASFQSLIFRISGAEDVIVGTPTLGRSKAEFMRVVGDFANPVALRGRLGAALSFRQVVAELRQTVHEALGAQDYPFSLLVRRLSPERASNRSPLFDAFFGLQLFDQSESLQRILVGSEHDTTFAAGLRLGPYPMPQQEGRFDLALELTVHDSAILGGFKYATDLFEERTIRSYADGWIELVGAALRDPAVTLAALPAPRIVTSGASAHEIGSLIDSLRQRDIQLFLDDDKLRVNAPKGALTDEMKAAIGARRDEIVDALRAARRDSAPRIAGLRALPRTPPLPVSSAQQRLWFLDRMRPGQLPYNVWITVRIRGPLDADILRHAINALNERHEMLRARIGDRDGVPELEILEPVPAALELVDLSHLPDAEREGFERCIEQIEVPFDLGRGRLARYGLVRLSSDEHLFTIVMHHAVADGWSTIIAMREICQWYAAFAAGSPPELPPLSLQYVDYAAWERDELHSGRMARHLTYWKQALAGAPEVLELPTDRPRPAVPTFKGKHARYSLGLPLLEALGRLGRQHEATLYMTLLAAWQVLLHRYSGQDDIVVGSPIANREDPALEGVIGCFVNNVVLRGDLHENPRFFELLRQVRDRSLSAFEHSALPFDVLVNALGQARTADRAPVFQVLFTLHSFPFECPPPPGLEVAVIDEVSPDTARFDLGVEIAVYDGKFVAQYEYATELFDPETIARMHGHYERLLNAIASDPTCRVRDLPLLTPVDERLLLGEWNATAADHDRRRCVHHLLEASARRTPDAVAVVAGHTKVTFRELDESANRLARLLVKLGVSPGSLVAVCVDRDIAMAITIAAVHKAGAAYVPLDPTHPSDRLRYTLEDAGVACAITIRRFAPLLAESGAPLVVLDEFERELATMPATPPAIVVRPEDRAYVIYTSGSTGRPKGVEVEHRNVVAFLEAMRREPGLSERDTLLAVTTLSFDIAGLELWLPLSVGARIVIASRADVLDGERLMALLEEHDITVMQATPASWRLLLDVGWSGKRNLKALCGGEAMPRDLAVALTERTSELWNMYGPTETTIWSTVSRIVDASGPITIGHPIHNTTVYVLEPSGRLTPPGIPGELCIGGEGVARGYHERPELTAERFVTITLPGGKKERVYRTGDLARVRADGRIDFLGRRDHQVKVRGYRIELGEIEAILATHSGVKECVVTVREDAPGDQRLVGYVVPTDGSIFDGEAARTTLRTKLPEYMVPSMFVTLTALPLTPNGKIDRKAMPRPEAAPNDAPHEMADPLMSPPQRRVAGIWRDVLRVERIGLHDNFFDVGGHSLLLAKLHASLRREFATDIALVELFQWTTIAAQAARLTAAPTADRALRRAQARAARQNHG